MREVRWVLQASQMGQDNWKDQDDRVYSGWFHSTSNDVPNPTIIQAYEKAVEELYWLDVRLIQVTRSLTRETLYETRRKEVTE